MSMVIVWRTAEGGREFLTLRAAGASDDEDWAWRPPSGRIEEGESVEACAARELLEETGLELPVSRVRDAAYPTFIAEAAAGAEVTLSFEHDAFAWVDAEELVRRTRPPHVAAGVRWGLLAGGLAEAVKGSDEVKQFGENRFRIRFMFTDELPDLDHVSTSIGLPFLGNRLILIEHAKYGELQPPGGHLEADETPEQALQREVLEEAGAIVARPRLIGYEEIEPLFDVPDGYRYPVPSFQLFYVADVIELLPFQPNAESLGRHLIEPEDSGTCSFIQDSGDLYMHGLTVALGAYSPST